jgi:hypothetical protein
LGVRWVGAIFLVGFLARIAGQFVLDAYSHPQVFEYQEIATNLLAGRGYTYASPDGGTYVASQSSPLYILLTAAVYAVTDQSETAMLVLQAIVGGLTAALACHLGRRVFSQPAGNAAGLLVALDPALVVYAAELHSLTLDAFANVVLISGSVAVRPRPTTGRLAMLGALFGLSALTRATALALLPLHVVWLGYGRVRRMLVPALAMITVALAVYAAWPVRNTLLLGQLTLGSSEASEWLWRGNNPAANGGSLTPAGQRMLDIAPPDFRARIQTATESERMDLYKDAALTFMKSDPGAAVGLYFKKLGAFWWGSEATGVLYPGVWSTLYYAWYLGVVLTAALGVWIGLSEKDTRSVSVLILSTCLIVSATQAIFYVEGRHRIAVEPLLLILSGAGLAWLRSLWQSRTDMTERLAAGKGRLSTNA